LDRYMADAPVSGLPKVGMTSPRLLTASD
jgi:hypothetical protein